MNALDIIRASNNGHQAEATHVASEKRSTYSIGDPALAAFLGLSGTSTAGINVNESSALGLTAVFRAIGIIAGTIAALPLKSYRTLSDDTRERVKTFLDDPGGPDGLTSFEWKETALVHLLLHGNAYLLHLYNGAGAVIGLQLLHPLAVNVKMDRNAPGGKVFTVSLEDGGQRDFTIEDITHVMGLSTTGLIGLSPIQVARNSIGAGIAGDAAAARMFTNGLLIGGIISSEDEDLTEEQAEQIKAGLKAKLAGTSNAGDIAVVNRNLKFSPWTMNPEDAQFLQSRSFQVEEVARIYGVPPHLLSQIEKQTSWGTGISEQNAALARYTLAPWTARIEERLSRLLARPRFVEFDYSGLLQPTPAEATANMIAEIGAGIRTIDEVRRLMNLPPLPKDALPAPPPPLNQEVPN